jgi:hypothetical protein
MDGMQFLTDSKKLDLTIHAPREENGQLAFGLRDFTDGSFPDLEWVSPAL